MKTTTNNKRSASAYITAIALFIGITLITAGCGTSTPTPSACITSNTLFQQIYTATVADTNNQDIVTYDNTIHEYTFTLSANKTVCSVGYQSIPAVASIPYIIKLQDTTTNTTIFTISSVFSSTATSYVAVPSTPTLVAGHTYILSRTLTNDLGNIGNTVGRLVKSIANPNLTFPAAVGVMTINSSRLHEASTSGAFNFGIPYIDIVFQ